MNKTKLAEKIVFVGAGSMAEAIIRGIVEQAIADPRQLFAVNRQDEAKMARIRDAYGIHTTSDPVLRETYIREADVIVLGMKPKDAASAISGIRHLIREEQLIVSVIAGLSISTMERLLGGKRAVARTMPNTSSTIGLGASGISFSDSVNPKQRETSTALFQAIGEAVQVEERLLDIVTGVSGSGPAYIYYVMEAMIRAGIEGGLTEDDARTLTVQTVLGAAQMVKVTKENPAELRRKVTSPNGTTQAAIESMEANGVGDAVSRAVLRAAERARELGEEIARQSLS